MTNTKTLADANVGDTILIKAVVTPSNTRLVNFVVQSTSGSRGWCASSDTIVEEITPAPAKYKLGTVLGGIGGPYVVIDEEGQRVVQVYNSDIGSSGTIHNISELNSPLQPVN